MRWKVPLTWTYLVSVPRSAFTATRSRMLLKSATGGRLSASAVCTRERGMKSDCTRPMRSLASVMAKLAEMSADVAWSTMSTRSAILVNATVST